MLGASRQGPGGSRLRQRGALEAQARSLGCGRDGRALEALKQELVYPLGLGLTGNAWDPENTDMNRMVYFKCDKRSPGGMQCPQSCQGPRVLFFNYRSAVPKAESLSS